MHFLYVIANRRFATLPKGDPTSYRAEDGHGFATTNRKCQINAPWSPKGDSKSLPRGKGFREGVTLNILFS